MGIMDYILVDPNKGKEAPKPTAGQAAAAAQPLAQPASHPASSPVGVNADMVNTLKQATFRRVTSYTTLLETAQRLVSVIADPMMRLRAAYATVNGAGRDVAAIAAAIDMHISDLETERQKFKSGVDQKRTNELGTMKQSMVTLNQSNEQLKQSIESIRSQIAGLEQQIQTNTTEISTTNGKVSQREAELARVEQEFDTAATYVRTELEQQKATIVTTLSV